MSFASFPRTCVRMAFVSAVFGELVTVWISSVFGVTCERICFDLVSFWRTYERADFVIFDVPVIVWFRQFFAYLRTYGFRHLLAYHVNVWISSRQFIAYL